MTDTRKYINLGIVAHVDAGKTSITELLLHKGGAIRNLGSVDQGTSQTDWLQVEKERGISVRSASASIEWKNKHINIIDTPGHVDFSAEVERSLRALDCAILVVSAVEGVQAHTETLWNALRKLAVPTLIFINKADRAGADIISVIKEIKNELSPQIIPIQTVENCGSPAVKIIHHFTNDIRVSQSEAIIEALANHDDELLTKYLSGETIPFFALKQKLAHQIEHGLIFPILMGSAKLDQGIDELLDFIDVAMPIARGDKSLPLSAIVYKVEHDKTIGRMASVRIFNGTLKNRDVVFNATQQIEEKVSQIRKLQGQKNTDIGELEAGDTAAVCGLSRVRAGDVLGSMEGIPGRVSIATPLFTVRVMADQDNEFQPLVTAIQLLADEDPTLDLLWLKDERELHIKIIGLIQLEILESVLHERFQLKVNFGKPTVIYKETPAGSAEAYEEYTMPKPCWAVVRFAIEPGLPGSGIGYKSMVGVNKIAARYQKEIERTIPVALKQGIKGWEVTDINITLVDGEHHNVHSRAGDFAVATSMAIMKGLQTGDTKLLEPILDFRIKAPENLLGKVASGLTQLRAVISTPDFDGDSFILSGTIPVATSLDYSANLSSLTGGKAKLKLTFSGYKECPAGEGETTPYRGVNPLDRAKFILKARKALQ